MIEEIPFESADSESVSEEQQLEEGKRPRLIRVPVEMDINRPTTSHTQDTEPRSLDKQQRLADFYLRLKKRTTTDVSPFAVLDLSPNCSWEDIQRRFTEYQQLFKDTLVNDVALTTKEDAQQRLELNEKIKHSYQLLQEKFFERPEYLKEAESIPSLIRRLNVLLRHGVSFFGENDEMVSVAGVLRNIETTLREVFAHPDMKSFHTGDLISARHNMLAHFEAELPRLIKICKELKSTSNSTTIKSSLQMLQHMGYDRFPVWNKFGKDTTMSIRDELQKLDILEHTKPGKREKFLYAVQNGVRDRFPNYSIYSHPLKRALSGNRTHI